MSAPFLTKAQLEKLPTPRILAYKRKVNRCQPCTEDNSCMAETDLEYNRQLEQIHQDLSAVLAKREHVVRPGHPAPDPTAKVEFHKWHDKTYFTYENRQETS